MSDEINTGSDTEPEVEGFLQRADGTAFVDLDVEAGAEEAVDLDERPAPPPRERRAQQFADQAEAETIVLTRQQYVSRTRRSILTGAAALTAAGLGWGWIQNQPEDGNIPFVLRRGFEWNEAVWETLYSPGRLAPEFTTAEAEEIRVNGRIGLDRPIDLDAWTMRVEGPDGDQIDEVDMDLFASGELPHVDQVTEHKCIEGWSNIVHWTGVRFSDFAARYGSVAAEAPYVQLATPDEEYYVGLDADTMNHPQTLLVWAWNGQFLTQERGAPLRLVTTLHYGIKALKRISRISFRSERPADYWAERGYDWDSSH